MYVTYSFSVSKFHKNLNIFFDSEKGKVIKYIKHFGLGVLVVSDLNL